MARQLVPLAQFRNTELLEQRLMMRDNNQWPIIPILAGEKIGPPKWPKMANDRKAIEDWHRSRGGLPKYLSTSLRMEGDWFVIDIDVTDQAAVDALLERLWDRWPDWFGYCLERNSGGVKLALFGRMSEPFKSPPTIVYEGGHKVELHGGQTTRHMLLFGMHPSGKPYAWVGDSPLNVHHDALPIFALEELDELRTLIADVMDPFFVRLTDQSDEAPGAKLWDLEPETPFFYADGSQTTCGQLDKDMDTGDEVNGILGSQAAWEASARKNHCRAKLNKYSNRFQVHDFQADVTHYFVGDAPAELVLPDDAIAALQALRDKVGGDDERAAPGEPRRPDITAPFEDQVGWMLAAFAHCVGDLVVPIWDIDMKRAVPVAEFHHRYQKINAPSATGKSLVYASKVWMNHKDRQEIDGYDMRPDMAFPLFVENGRLYKNSYRPEPHTGEGETDTLVEFLEHLCPVAAERDKHIDSIAHKWLHPAIPGPATIMVAEGDNGDEQSGTGRGTWFSILETLFGWRYAKRVDWDIVTGISPQAVYTDWQATQVLAFVEEAKEAGSTGFTAKRGVYEKLKAVIDPAPRRATVKPKYGKIYDAMLNCTFLFATNHADAIMVPASDRRFLMVSNGAPLSDDLARRIHAWRAVPGNIAAMARWLAARDVAAYEPFAAPMPTKARQRMVEMATNDFDQLVREAVRSLKGHYFTRSQVAEWVRNNGGAELMQTGYAQFGAAFKRITWALSEPGVRPKIQWRFKASTGTYAERAYARDEAHMLHAEANMDHDQVRAEILKNGSEDKVGPRKVIVESYNERQSKA